MGNPRNNSGKKKINILLLKCMCIQNSLRVCAYMHLYFMLMSLLVGIIIENLDIGFLINIIIEI